MLSVAAAMALGRLQAIAEIGFSRNLAESTKSQP